MSFRLTAFFILFTGVVSAQSNHARSVELSFVPTINGENLILGKSYSLFSDTFTISACRFYISQIQFLKDGEFVFADPTSAHLVDCSDERSTNIEIFCSNNIEFTRAQFLVGIDSATNSSGALDGDLDPTKGMYWSWQSGYINIKIEGAKTSEDSEKAEFQFHLGGYLPPNLAAQIVNIDVANTDSIQLEVDLEQFLKSIDLKARQRVMSPSAEALILSGEFSNSIHLKNAQ